MLFFLRQCLCRYVRKRSTKNRVSGSKRQTKSEGGPWVPTQCHKSFGLDLLSETCFSWTANLLRNGQLGLDVFAKLDISWQDSWLGCQIYDLARWLHPLEPGQRTSESNRNPCPRSAWSTAPALSLRVIVPLLHNGQWGAEMWLHCTLDQMLVFPMIHFFAIQSFYFSRIQSSRGKSPEIVCSCGKLLVGWEVRGKSMTTIWWTKSWSHSRIHQWQDCLATTNQSGDRTTRGSAASLNSHIHHLFFWKLVLKLPANFPNRSWLDDTSNPTRWLLLGLCSCHEWTAERQQLLASRKTCSCNRLAPGWARYNRFYGWMARRNMNVCRRSWDNIYQVSSLWSSSPKPWSLSTNTSGGESAWLQAPGITCQLPAQGSLQVATCLSKIKSYDFDLVCYAQNFCQPAHFNNGTQKLKQKLWCYIWSGTAVLWGKYWHSSYMMTPEENSSPSMRYSSCLPLLSSWWQLGQ